MMECLLSSDEITVKLKEPGVHQIGIIVDMDNLISESNEFNNLVKEFKEIQSLAVSLRSKFTFPAICYSEEGLQV